RPPSPASGVGGRVRELGLARQTPPNLRTEWHARRLPFPNPGNAHSPYVRSLGQVVPAELAGPLDLDLVIERLRIVVVGQLQALPGGQAVQNLENAGVPLPRRNVPHVQLQDRLRLSRHDDHPLFDRVITATVTAHPHRAGRPCRGLPTEYAKTRPGTVTSAPDGV